MDSFLNNCGLGFAIDKFAKEKIEMANLEKLTKSQIKELLPIIGDRHKLEDAIEIYRKRKRTQDDCPIARKLSKGRTGELVADYTLSREKNEGTKRLQKNDVNKKNKIIEILRTNVALTAQLTEMVENVLETHSSVLFEEYRNNMLGWSLIDFDEGKLNCPLCTTPITLQFRKTGPFKWMVNNYKRHLEDHYEIADSNLKGRSNSDDKWHAFGDSNVVMRNCSVVLDMLEIVISEEEPNNLIEASDDIDKVDDDIEKVDDDADKVDDDADKVDDDIEKIDDDTDKVDDDADKVDDDIDKVGDDTDKVDDDTDKVDDDTDKVDDDIEKVDDDTDKVDDDADKVDDDIDKVGDDTDKVDDDTDKVDDDIDKVDDDANKVDDDIDKVDDDIDKVDDDIDKVGDDTDKVDDDTDKVDDDTDKVDDDADKVDDDIEKIDDDADKVDDDIDKVGDNRIVEKEIPLQEYTVEGYQYYLTLMRGNLQVHQTDVVYILRDIPITADVQSTSKSPPKHTYKTIGKFEYNECDIFRVERLWKDDKGKRFVYGHHYLRPKETFCKPTQKFYQNEIVRVPLYEKLPINLIMGRCWVLDPKTFCKGRPIDCEENHVYICEYRVDKNARVFSKISNPQYPVSTKSNAFQNFERKLKISRNYSPHHNVILPKKKKSKELVKSENAQQD